MAGSTAGRIAGVSRVLNEEDIIEPFIRHHAALVHLHIILDNGSTDRTLEILRALRAEGLSLQVYQGSSAIFVERLYNTGLYRLAVQEQADWVLFLDCDEFIDLRRVPEGLAGFLATVPPDIRCVQVPLVNYVAPTAASGADLNPARRLARREREAYASKVFIRGMDPRRVMIEAGNHAAMLDDVIDDGMPQDRLVLAHFPERSPYQAAAKAIVGRLKIVASGQDGVHPTWAWHYTAAFEAMKQDPRSWIAQAERRASERAASADLVHDPIGYLGGDLVHTREADYPARLVALVTRYAETLAASHGGILDRRRLVRTDLLRKASVAQRLF